MMKKHYVIWLLATLLMSPLSALADENGKSGNVSWSFKSSTGKLTLSGKGDMKDYKFYDKVPWLKFKNSIIQVEIKEGITSVGRYAFYDCDKLTVVDIPNTVTRIGWNAFGTCDKISSITLPESVIEIGFDAFWKCDNLQTINIPESVKYIGDFAFSHCSNLNPVTLPNNLIDIGMHVFNGCDKFPVIDHIRYADWYLTEVVDTTLSTYTIKEGTKWIGGFAFSQCHKMTSITIPESVVRIGIGAFWTCNKLSSVTWNAKRYVPEYYVFLDSPQITSFSFGNEVEYIPNKICVSMTKLTSIVIPNSVKSIGYYAFQGCTGLKSITIPNSVTNISPGAFYGCTELNRVNIFSPLISIPKDVFKKCNKIKNVIAPDGMTLPKELTKQASVLRISVEPPKLEIVPKSLCLHELTGNDEIDTDENCSIRFTVKNVGKGDSRGCIVSSSITPESPFVVFPKQLEPFDIHPNEVKDIEIPITTTKDAKDVTIQYAISIADIQGERISPVTIPISIHHATTPLIKLHHSELHAHTSTAQKGQQISARLIFKNEGEGIAKNVLCKFTLPSSCTPVDKSQIQWKKEFLFAGKDTAVSLDFLPLVNAPDTIAIKYSLSEKYGKYAESGSIPIIFGETPTFRITSSEDKALAIAGTPRISIITNTSVSILRPDWYNTYHNPQNIKSPFPYAVIQIELKGDKEAIDLAKERLSLTMGGKHIVEAKNTKETNTIYFLVHCRNEYIDLDCGDGCEPINIWNTRLEPNKVYSGTVQVKIPKQ